MTRNTPYRKKYEALVPVTDRMAKNLERSLRGTITSTDHIQAYADLERYRELRNKA